jgi:hypothetical protein
MATTSFRALTPFSDARETSEVVNNILQGKLNATATVTLSNSSTTTTVPDYRVGGDSVILFMPTTADAATENIWVSARSKNSFIITHASASTTRTYAYAVIG